MHAVPVRSSGCRERWTSSGTTPTQTSAPPTLVVDGLAVEPLVPQPAATTSNTTAPHAATTPLDRRHTVCVTHAIPTRGYNAAVGPKGRVNRPVVDLRRVGPRFAPNCQSALADQPRRP